MNPQVTPPPLPPDLQQATLGVLPQPLSASPLGAEHADVIGNFYKSAGQLPALQAAVGGDKFNTGVKVDNDAAAAQAAKDAGDPSKYKQIPKPDGGYGFLDPSGKEISAYDYSRATGTPLDKILSDSQNPVDQGFVQDYTNLQDYLHAWINGDKAMIDTIQTENPALKNIKSPQELTQLFRQHYPTVFGGTQNGNQPVSSTFIPNAQAAANNADYTGTSGGSGIGQ